MKKTILFALIIAVVAALCSCNLDAQDGIYSAIADSTQESSIKVKSYLGTYDNCYYFLTEDSITRKAFGTATVDFKSISATGNYAVEAALLSDGSILVHRHDGKIYKYDKTGSNGTAITNLTATELLNNGVIVGSNGTTKGLFKADGTLLVSNATIKTVLECGDLVLVEDENHKISIYNNTGAIVTDIDSSETNTNLTVGFVSIDSSYYILKSDGSVYQLDTTNKTLKSLTSISSSSDKTSSFAYKEGSTNYLVFKVSENFVKINTTDNSTSNVTTGYGSLRQNDVVNIKQAGSGPEQIVATYANGVYKIDPTSSSAPEQIL